MIYIGLVSTRVKSFDTGLVYIKTKTIDTDMVWTKVKTIDTSLIGTRVKMLTQVWLAGESKIYISIILSRVKDVNRGTLNSWPMYMK